MKVIALPEVRDCLLYTSDAADEATRGERIPHGADSDSL